MLQTKLAILQSSDWRYSKGDLGTTVNKVMILFPGNHTVNTSTKEGKERTDLGKPKNTGQQ